MIKRIVRDIIYPCGDCGHPLTEKWRPMEDRSPFSWDYYCKSCGSKFRYNELTVSEVAWTLTHLLTPSPAGPAGNDEKEKLK